jgi:hypothetical protein
MTDSLFSLARRRGAAAVRDTFWRTWPSRIVPLWKIAERLDRRDARLAVDAWFDHVRGCDGC